MNAVADIDVPVSKRSSSPRPPADGDEVRQFYDRSHSSEPYKNWKMESQSRAVCGEYADTSVKFLDQIEPPSSTPPNPYKWAESLQCLLEDYEGISLFEIFLNQEGQDKKCLHFLLACRGVKKHDTSNREASYKLYKAIFRNSRKLSAISDETRKVIKQKLSSNTGVDNTIFDAAQREIKAYITKTTYSIFLKSDLYIQYLKKFKDANSPEKEHALTSEAAECLPTVHEDAQLENNKILNSSKSKSEGPARILQWPHNYHAKYNNPCLPASARDSELQSLPSDAATVGTMSLADYNVDISMGSHSEQLKHLQKASKFALLKETSIENKIIAHAQKLNPDADKIPIKLSSYEEFSQILSEKLNELEGKERRKKCVEEENVQDILDQHIAENSEVFDCTPPERPTNVIDKSRMHPQHSSGYSEPSSSYAIVHKHSQSSQLTVPNSIIKCRRDRDNKSPDSALYDSSYEDKPVDYSTCSKHSSKRYAFKRNSLLNSSFADSGIGSSYESIPTLPKKPNRKSCSLSAIDEATANTVSDVTRIFYTYGRDSVPYLSKIPGKNITLRKFKTLLTKKGNFRFFFKTTSNDFGTRVVFEEVNEDHKILPLIEGKVFCLIETVDD